MPKRPSAPARSAAALDRWTVVLAAVFVLCGIGLPLVGAGVFHGADLLRTEPPWSATEPTGFTPHLPVVGDTVDSVVPPVAEFRDRLWHGDFASWEPYTVGGTPLGAVPHLSLFSPLGLPYLLLPTWYAPAVGKLLELLAAIGGTLLFARRLGLSRAAGVLGGLVFASSGFLVTWTNWPHTKVAALVPALFWAVERLLQRRRPAGVALLGAVVASMLLGGFPAVTGWALYAAAAYAVVRLVGEHGSRLRAATTGAALTAAGVALGVGLAAVQVLPFLRQYAGIAGAFDRGQAPDRHLPSWSLLTALVPDAFGTTLAGSPYFGPVNPVEVIAYAGVAAVLLAIAGVAARPVAGVPGGVRGYLAAALGTVTMLCWVGGPPLALVQELPIFSDNVVYRLRSLFGFFVAVLAALGYEALRRGVLREPASRWRRSVSAAVWVVAALGIGFVTWRATVYAGQRGRLGQLAGRLPVPVLLAAGTLALLGLAALRWRHASPTRGVVLAALPVLVLVQALSFVLPFWPRTARADFYPRTPAHDFLAASLGHDRFDAEAGVFMPSTGAYYGLRTATGHAFRAQTWRDLLLAADPVGYQSVSYLRFSGQNAPVTIHSPVLDRMAVKYFAFAPGALPLGDPVTVGRAAGEAVLRDGRSVQATVPAAALRGVGLQLTSGVPRPPDGFARLDAEVLDRSGRVLARSSRRLLDGTGGPGPFYVAVTGEGARSAPGGTVRVRFTLRAPGSTLRLARTEAGVPVLPTVRALADGLRLVYAADAVIYQRLTALPRIRWAARAEVVPDPDEVVRRVAAGPAADTVLLEPPGSGGPAASGGPAGSAGAGTAVAVTGPAGSAGGARVDVLEDSGDTIRARVDAPVPGHLVVADALQQGWTVTVDGRPALLRPADHAFVAVEVPAGRHEVTYAYRPPGRPLGGVVTALALAALAALLVADRLRRRERIA